MRTVTFACNPTSWVDGGIVPGGMADRLIRPIIEHLDAPYEITDRPMPGHRVNVFYTHPRSYPEHTTDGARSVFVSHGIADKNWREARRVEGFDYVATSGPAWTRRLVERDFPADRIIEVGYTKLDPLITDPPAPMWPAPDGRIRVLWAPTHGGGGESFRHATSPPATGGARRSTHWQPELVRDAFPSDQYALLEARHPRHRPDGRATFAEYVGADVVIADGGSTIYEAWALGLPVVFPAWLLEAAMTQGRATFEADLYRRRIGRHATDVADMVELVNAAAVDGITPAERDYVEPILPTAYRGRSGAMHAEALDDIAADADQVRHADTAPKITLRHRSGRILHLARESGHAARLGSSPAWREI